MGNLLRSWLIGEVYFRAYCLLGAPMDTSHRLFLDRFVILLLIFLFSKLALGFVKYYFLCSSIVEYL